ncbi:TetR/AcrR family transcriptional regulator [Candidatus Saccharibacteria bacterium]|nr:TetR/AcrR family transcriptional regulator [Candidatus Saccharibacteria bacterium]
MTAEFTKQAIKQAFLELLREKSMSEISVREISKKCGVSRNTFYYHFRDIPAVVEAIVVDQADELVAKHPTMNSIEECLYAVLDLTRDNQIVVRHIYNSLSRSVFEKYLFEVCYILAENYWNNMMLSRRASSGDSDGPFNGEDTDGDGVSDIHGPSRRVIIDCYASALFGLAMRWLANGLDDSVARKDVPEIVKILKGQV